MPLLIEQLSLSVAQRQAIERVIAPQWRSIFYDRDAIIDELRVILGSTSAAQMVELGVLRSRAVFDSEAVTDIFNTGARTAWLDVDDCDPQTADAIGAQAVANAVHFATVHAAAASVPEGPARDAVLALLDTRPVVDRSERMTVRTAAEQHLDSVAQTVYDAQADGDWLTTVDGSPNVASYAAARAVLALDLAENAHVAGWNERVEHEAGPHDRAAEQNELTAERLRTQTDTNARIRRLAARHAYAAEGDRIAAARIRLDLR